MKKIIAIVAVVFLLAAALYFRAQNGGDAGVAGKSSEGGGQGMENSVVTDSSGGNKQASALRPVSKEGDASEPVPVALPVPEPLAFTHGPAEFAKGEAQNSTVSADGLQMGNDLTFVCRTMPYNYFGIYVSPEQNTTEFHKLVLNPEIVVPAESAATFEFRTKTTTGQWTVWQEVSKEEFRQPIMLENPATAWQYRINLYANDPAQGPKVRKLHVAVQATHALAAGQ